ncbi:MAG: hypothetical protein KAT65_20015, partial [Methanophagales archaeon]|nr:hypothetical protein [Methanophagales archaeon]
MVSVMAMAVFIPVVAAEDLESLRLKSTTGVMDETGTPLLGDGTPPSDLIQIIKSYDGTIDPPDPTKPNYIGGNDVLQDVAYAGLGYPFNPDEGKFTRAVGDPYGAGCPKEGDYFICRAWNAPTIDEATHYGDTPLWQAPFGNLNPEYDY